MRQRSLDLGSRHPACSQHAVSPWARLWGDEGPLHSAERGTGLGTELFEWAIEESRRLGAQLVQLTSDVKRPDAHRFHERFGLRPTHVGFKLDL